MSLTNVILPEGQPQEFTAPATVTAGTCIKIGELLVYPLVSVASGAKFNGIIRGRVVHVKLTAQAWSEGDQVNWDDTNKRFTTVTTGNFKAGVAAKAATTSDATGEVFLTGVHLGAALA